MRRLAVLLKSNLRQVEKAELLSVGASNKSDIMEQKFLKATGDLSKKFNPKLRRPENGRKQRV